MIQNEKSTIIRDWALVLTFRKHGVSKFDAKKLTKAMLTALRNSSIKNNWFYDITAVISELNPKTKQKERIHVHLLLHALPISSVKGWIKKYWYTRHGIVEYEPVRDKDKLLLYMIAQASEIFEQSRTPKLKQ